MLPIYLISEYEKLVKPILLKAGLPETSSKFHNRIYDDHVKFYILALKTETKMSYREIIDFLQKTNVFRNLALAKAPHFSTIHKFLMRMGKDFFRKLVREIYELVGDKGGIVGVDTTGIEITYSSKHYDKRIERKNKGFVKLSTMMDIKNRSLVDVYAEESHKHDLRMLDQHFKVVNMKSFGIFVGDKGYDDSTKLYWKLKKNDVEMQVPQKNHYSGKKYTLRRGTIIQGRRRREFIESIYHQRSLLESGNFSLKWHFGSFVNAKNKENKVKETYLKAVLYNLRRLKDSLLSLLEALIFKQFYRATLTRKLLYCCSELLSWEGSSWSQTRSTKARLRR